MTIAWTIVRACIIAIIVVAVGELSNRYPRWAALLLSLPIVSILAILVSWVQYHDPASISRFARETLILVPLGLPFFVPFLFAQRLGFWTSFGSGIVLVVLVVGTWLMVAPAK